MTKIKKITRMRKKTFFSFVFILLLLAPVASVCSLLPYVDHGIDHNVDLAGFQTLGLLGAHDIAELFDCDKEVLSDLAKMEKILIQAAHVAGAKKIGHITHKTDEKINSCIVLVSESHISIHAFPLLGYAAVDIFTCGACNNKEALAYIKQQLQVQSNHHKKIMRGICKQEVSHVQYSSNKDYQGGERLGEHLIVELYGCEESIINNEKNIEEILKKAAQKTGAQVIGSVPYKFHPQGVSCIVLATNGTQITVHTWPELPEKYCAIDILTCGSCKPDEALAFLIKELKAKSLQVAKIPRGFSPVCSLEESK